MYILIYMYVYIYICIYIGLRFNSSLIRVCNSALSISLSLFNLHIYFMEKPMVDALLPDRCAKEILYMQAGEA